MNSFIRTVEFLLSSQSIKRYFLEKLFWTHLSFVLLIWKEVTMMNIISGLNGEIIK